MAGPKAGRKPKRIRERRGRVHFLDMGSGPKALRACYMAESLLDRRQPGRVVAVDHVKPGKHPLFEHDDLRNLEFVGSDAGEYLDSLEPGSVDIMNFDISLMPPDIERKYRRLNPDLLPDEKHIPLTKEFADKIKRVMHDRSRLLVAVPVGVHPGLTKEMEKELRKHGFRTRVHPNRKMHSLFLGKGGQSESSMMFNSKKKMLFHEYLDMVNYISARKPGKKTD